MTDRPDRPDRPSPRTDADEAYRQFMAMPDSEWSGLLKSLLGGGVLEFEEQKGFDRALKERGWRPLLGGDEDHDAD